MGGIACTKNYFEIFKLLILDPRCDPNVKNNYDQTVSQHACANGKFEYVELLLQHPSISFEVPQVNTNTRLDQVCFLKFYVLGIPLVTEYQTLCYWLNN